MVHHIVLWNLKPELTESDRKEAGAIIKEKLEAIKDEVTGIVSLEVIINEFSSSNRDVALISTFESAEALNAYQIHPAHVRAGEYVRSVTCDRACLDY